MKVIFLDIDGVLNHTPCCLKGPRIMPQQAEHLAALIRATDAKIVLTTSWRKWLSDELMTMEGFSRLLYTHGIAASVVGVAEPIRSMPLLLGRAEAIRAYVVANGITRYVVLDDRELDVPNLVQTDGDVGLTCENVLDAYRILRDGG